MYRYPTASDDKTDIVVETIYIDIEDVEIVIGKDNANIADIKSVTRVDEIICPSASEPTMFVVSGSAVSVTHAVNILNHFFNVSKQSRTSKVDPLCIYDMYTNLFISGSIFTACYV